jgi:histidine phosphotransferase ChpT
MTGTLDMHVVELLAARLCHELIGPIAAISNGVEILAEGDAGFAADAAQLVGASARRAGARLQFYRFVYGFTRRGGFSGPPPHELADGYFAETRIACTYEDGARTLPLEWQKLGCNLLLVGAEALPRGGSLSLCAGACGPELVVSGDTDGLAPPTEAALDLSCPVEELSARTVQGYFTGLLARALGRRLRGVPVAPQGFRLATAMPEDQAAASVPPADISSFGSSSGRNAISGAAGSRKT